MEDITKKEIALYIFIVALGIFITGVQVGIAHGKELQRQEYYDYICSN